MTEPIWISSDVTRAIHLRQIAEHGGLSGIRDDGLLESALARPRQRWSLAEPRPDLLELAAAYAYGISNNHPFRDGNKRVALVVSQLFLEINGIVLETTQEDKYSTYLRLAAGNLSEEKLCEWMRSIAKHN